MKKKLVIVLAVVLTLTLLLTSTTYVAAWGYTVEVKLTMSYYRESGRYWCGPCSGVSIGWYYKQQYPNLPSPKSEMYDRLYDYMDTSPLGPTSPDNYGPGFVEMALHYGYDNFSYYHYETVTADNSDDIFDDIVNAIDNGWPVAVAATGALKGFRGVEAISTDEEHPTNHWPCEVGHWIAIKGYSYRQSLWPPGQAPYDLRIVCTDNWSKANKLWLYWDELVDKVRDNLEVVIIKGEDDTPDGPAVEDFEWGSDGDSLEDWQDNGNGGEVDWTVSTRGSSVAEIDTVQARPGGTRSARFYRDGSKNVYAYYSLFKPSCIGFYVMKEDTAYADFRNGDGSHAIWVRINSAEQLQYFDTRWRTVRTLLPDKWYYIEFKNIYWAAGTFDIYVGGIRRAQGAKMRAWGGFKGKLYFENLSPSTGSFWIDDITDSLRQL